MIMPNLSAFNTALHSWIEIFMRLSMRNFLQFSRDNGFSMSQIGALFRIHSKGTCGVSDIGDDLGITSAAASQMLDRLVQQGLVNRSEDPLDRRGKQIVLTSKGERILKESIQARQGWLDAVAQQLTPQEQQQVVAALNILVEKASLLEKNVLSK
jgi:DNA-binding MarR family transcriptional regulator